MLLLPGWSLALPPLPRLLPNRCAASEDDAEMECATPAPTVEEEEEGKLLVRLLAIATDHTTIGCFLPLSCSGARRWNAIPNFTQ